MPNLSDMIAARPPGKRCILFKKTSTCTDGKRIKGYIQSYMDETAKRENREEMASVGTTEGKIAFGVKYLSKKERGKVYAMGFLAKEVEAQTGKTIEEITNHELSTAIQGIWKQRIEQKKLKKVAHKMVFSLDPEICQMMELAKLPVDEVLISAVEETFDRYRNQFYPGHTLGYLVGVHHDRAHIHAHILLYPQTDLGTPINISHRSKTKLPDGTYTRIDYQGFIKDTVTGLVKTFYEEKIRSPVRATQLPADYKSQEKLLTLAAVNAVEKEMLTAASQGQPFDKSSFWTKVQFTKKQLKTAAPDVVRKSLEGAYERKLKDFSKLDPNLAEKDLEEAKALSEKIQQEMAASFKAYKNAGTRGKTLSWAALKELKQDFYKAKKVFYKGTKLVWSVPGFLNDENGRWFLNRMEKDDELGRTLKRTFLEVKKEFDQASTQQAVREVEGAYRFVPHPWRIRRTAVDQALATLEQLRKERIQKAEEELEAEKTKKKRELERQAELKSRRDLLLLQVSLCTNLLKNRKPIFLRQYEGWKATNTPIPLSLEGVESMEAAFTKKVESATQAHYEPKIYTPELRKAIGTTDSEAKEVAASIEKSRPPKHVASGWNQSLPLSKRDRDRILNLLRGKIPPNIDIEPDTPGI